ncbi:MAG: RuBisCO accumulation factor 1 [Elainellaceae cyanobacterium]
MTPPENPADSPHQPTANIDSSIDTDALIQALRRKEGNWIGWAIACQQLQKAGHSPQQIFEATGFEPIQQNQIIVAAQVYKSLEAADVSPEVRSRFEIRGSDALYELRILNQVERAITAHLLYRHNADSTTAHEFAKAVKEYGRRSKPPEGFGFFDQAPGDALAHYYWKLARQQSDLQARSRLIASGLRYADSDTARKQLEALLTDFAVVRQRKAPLLPIYRFDSEEHMPRVLPVVGQLPLTVADLRAVPVVDEEGPFKFVKHSGTAAWVALPGWQVLLLAEDPVVLITQSDRLPTEMSPPVEPVLLVVDRASREWTPDSYFIVAQSEQIEVAWFDEAPSAPLLGRVILVLRPKKVLDEEFVKDPWQFEE